MDLRVQDKVFIVTGGASGIGAAICRALSEEGGIPVVVDVNTDAGNQIVGSLERGVFFHADVTSASSCHQVVTETKTKFGRIDGIVNNAGVNDGVGLQNGDPAKFLHSMNNNAGHYFAMVHYALPSLREAKGAVVNIGSKTSLTGQGNTSGYVAAKGAILALTREWAAELAADGVRVNAVVPAEVWTPMYASWLKSHPDPEDARRRITARIPLGHRMTTPEEIADTVVFLLSSRASHITGQWIHVDGGYVHLDRALTDSKHPPS